MKKRSLFIIATTVVVLLLALVFNACGITGGTGSESSEEKKGKTSTETDIYTTLNAMLNNVGYPMTLTTKTMENGYAFNGSYAITGTEDSYSVNYSYEKLSTFEITDSGEIILPDGFKTTVTGNMKVKDGKIIERDGAEANINTEALSVRGMTLSENDLSNVKTENGVFSASITSLQAVTGLDASVTAATISITYNETKITKMTLNYSTSSSQTEFTYSFN